MGRHRRSAAGRAATGRATGVTTTHGSYGSGYDPQDSYNFASVGTATYPGQEDPDPTRAVTPTCSRRRRSTRSTGARATRPPTVPGAAGRTAGARGTS